MARYTPAFIDSVRHDCEETDDSLRTIAARHAISERTVRRMIESEGWERRDRQPRDLPDPMHLLREAEALAAAGDRSGTQDSPEPEAADSGAAAQRIERLLERELAAEEQVRARLGKQPRTAAEAERVARTLATLTRTLQTLQRLRGPMQPSDDPDDAFDDDMPTDIDAFRRALAEKIDAFVESRTEPWETEGKLLGPLPGW